MGFWQQVKRVRNQAPRQSGFPCLVFIVVQFTLWSACVGLGLYQWHRWGWI